MVEISKTHWTVSDWHEEIEHRFASRECGAEPFININANDHREFDAIFLGGGAAGRFGASYLRAMGGRPLIIDRWPFLGGSCPHHACVPHHIFSDVAAQLLLERTFSGQLWFQNMKDKRVSILEIIAMFRQGRTGPHAFMNYQSKEQLELEFVLNAAGTILDSHTVSAADQTYQTRNIVLATGSRPKELSFDGHELTGIFDHVSLVDALEYDPGSTVVVVGGGKTAIEYACFFNATGRRTVVVSRDLPLSIIPDDETRTYLLTQMQGQGMEFFSGSELLAAAGDQQGRVKSVRIRTSSGEIFVETDCVFLGLGQLPNSEYAKEALGVKLGEEGCVEVDSRMCTSVPNVYAVGDVVGSPMEMFKARKSGMYAARNIMGEQAHYHIGEYPDFMHTHYEVCWLGLGEEEARNRYPEVVVLKLPPDNPDGHNVALPAGDRMMLYAMMKPHLSGFQKLVIDGISRRILGAFHVGSGAKDGFQYLAPMVRRGLTVDELGEMDELFLNPSYFIQLCRLRAGSKILRDM